MKIRSWIFLLVLLAATSYLLMRFQIVSVETIVLLWVLGMTVGMFLFAYFFLAPNNYFFTFVREGTVKIVLRGDAFSCCILQWEGHRFDEEKVGDDRWNIVEDKSTSGQPFWGMIYYGLFPIFDILVYKFQWTGVDESGKVVHHPKEKLDYVLVRDDTYWFLVEDAEDKNLFPLRVEIVATIQVVNPYRAVFRVQNWLETTVNRLKPVVRDITTQNAYEDWIKDPLAMGDRIMEKASGGSDPLVQELEQRYGIRVRKVQVKKVDPLAEFREKTLAPYLARLDREATVIRADAEAQRIEKVFSQVKEFGRLGELLKTLEAIEKSPLAASLSVQAVPGLADAFKGVFGSSDLSREELLALREMLKKHLGQGGA